MMRPSNKTNIVSRRGADVSEFTRGLICGLSLHANWTNTAISRELGIPRTTVKLFVSEGKTSAKSRLGLKKKLNERE